VKPLIRAIVDAAALRHNLARVRATAPGARVMAVIKANAYGHGLVPAARALGLTDGFAVARLEEGLALRAAGLPNPVLLLEGVFSPGQLAVAAQQRFDIMVHSFEQLELLEGRADGGPLSAWLKVDTGMNRLGFPRRAVRAAWERLRRVPNVTPDPTLVTHLACADEVDDRATSAQLRTFEEITAGRGGARSIANSAGLFAVACEPRRLGAARHRALRGVAVPVRDGPRARAPAGDDAADQVIAREGSCVSGETVGYGGTWRASRPTRIAVGRGRLRRRLSARRRFRHASAGRRTPRTRGRPRLDGHADRRRHFTAGRRPGTRWCCGGGPARRGDRAPRRDHSLRADLRRQPAGTPRGLLAAGPRGAGQPRKNPILTAGELHHVVVLQAPCLRPDRRAVHERVVALAPALHVHDVVALGTAGDGQPPARRVARAW